MLKSEKERLIIENEIRPNRYAANAMIGVVAALLLVLVLNELNIYDVDRNVMRLCCLISLVLLLIPRIIIRKEKWLSHPASKYVIMTVIVLVTLIITVLLNAHVTLVFIFPMLLASQYRSYRISSIAFLSSCGCCVLSPLLAYFLGTWSLDYLSGHIETLCSVTITATPAVSVNVLLDIAKMFLYMILPQLFILSAFGIIMFSVTKKGIENLKDQLQIIHMSETDSLTGLLNRNSFETNLSAYPAASKKSIACIYIDVNGLHELNNQYGHAAGDKMLQLVAETLTKHFGKDDTYRIGGDEFLAFTKDLELPEVEERVRQITEAIHRQGYHVSIEVSLMKASDDMNSLVRTAEERMFEDKRSYYEQKGNDRRRRS